MACVLKPLEKGKEYELLHLLGLFHKSLQMRRPEIIAKVSEGE